MFYIQRKTIGRIVIGVGLIGILVGGIYGVRIYSEQVRKDQAIASLREQETAQTNESVVEPTESTGSEDTASTLASTSTGALPASGMSSPLDIVVFGLLIYSVHAYFRSRVRRTVHTLTY